MKKMTYEAPEIELIVLNTREDVLSSSKIEGLDKDFGIEFPY